MNKKKFLLILCYQLCLVTLCYSQWNQTGFLSPTVAVNPLGWYYPLNVCKYDSIYSYGGYHIGCPCPEFALSSDSGQTFTPTIMAGPWNSTFNKEILGGQDYLWERKWIASDFSNSRFFLKIISPGGFVEQKFRDFNFNIPDSSIILGIELKVIGYENSAIPYIAVDLLQINIYYYIISGIIEKQSNTERIKIFPNPASNKVTLNLVDNPNIGNISLDFFTLEGRQVLHRNIKNIDEEIDIQNLSPGIYFLITVALRINC